MIKEYLGEQIIELENRFQSEYLLNNPELFYDTGFRVMKNQERSCLVPCHRLKYNGKIKLVYFTSEYSTMAQVLRDTDTEHIDIVISNLFRAIKEVRGNGFLNVSYLETRPDKIYVENNTYAVKLIYLPVNIPGVGAQTEAFENEVHAQLEKVMRETRPAEVEHLNISEKKENLVLMSVDNQLTIEVTGDEFLIGKNAEKVNGVIEGNSAVSRVHCKIIKKNMKYYLADMNSANGTYVNNQRITQDNPVEIDEGARVKLANMEFIVRR